MSRKKSTDHVVTGDNSLRCRNCGDEQPVAMPISISVYAAMAKAYEREHRACKPSEAGAARYAYGGVREWERSWDTGISSRAIFDTFMGYGLSSFGGGVPRDPADFGRCYRLLKVAPPEWRANLSRVAERYPAWRPLVERWAELEALYEEELPTGKAPKLYALMQELVEAGRAVRS